MPRRANGSRVRTVDDVAKNVEYARARFSRSKLANHVVATGASHRGSARRIAAEVAIASLIAATSSGGS